MPTELWPPQRQLSTVQPVTLPVTLASQIARALARRGRRSSARTLGPAACMASTLELSGLLGTVRDSEVAQARFSAPGLLRQLQRRLQAAMARPAVAAARPRCLTPVWLRALARRQAENAVRRAHPPRLWDKRCAAMALSHPALVLASSSPLISLRVS